MFEKYSAKCCLKKMKLLRTSSISFVSVINLKTVC